MSLPIQNLHDLVLGLATDNALGSAFLSDPGAVLSGAGLTDITALDVQEVAPLVADSLPAPVAGAIESALGNLPTDAFGANDLTGAVAQLQTVAGAVQALPGEVSGTDFDLGGTGVDGVTGSLTSDVADLTGKAGVGAEGLTGGLTAGDTPLGGLTGGVIATTDQVAVGLDSPLGTYGLATDNLSLPSFDSVSDLGGSLDSAALTQAAPLNDTVAGYVSSAGSFVAGTVADNGDTLAGHVSSVTGVAAAVPMAAGGEELGTGINTVTDTVSNGISHLPAVPAPNVLPQDLPVHAVAELPHSLPTPAIAPQVTHAVEGTLSQTPLAHASSLPDVSHVDAGSVTDTVHDTVSGAVSQSPLGDALHGALPDAGSVLPTDVLHGDLPLGPLG